jgi:tetratricopeptide (TPR) repeat protein
MEKAWQLDKGDGVAQRMLDILLDKSARNIKRTEEVLIEMGDARVSQNPGFLMALAKVRIAQNQQQNANRAVLDALRLLAPADARLMLIWHTDMRELQPDRRQHARFLEVAINQGAVAGAADWLGYFRAGLLVEEDATFQQAIEAFQLLARGAQPEIIRLLSWRTLGGKFYGKSDFVQAEAMWREGLSAYPDDPELNNNLAYLLAVHLNRPAEAIALAERATKAAPENPDIADTLAFALRKSGKVSEAIGVFEGALGKITTANTGVTMLSHYAEALLELSAQAPTPEERQRLRQRAVDQLDAASNILAQPGVEVTTEARQEYERVRALVGN